MIVSTRRQTRRRDIRLHRARLDRADWTIVDGLPVTTVVRTITDLAGSGLDIGHLAHVLQDSLRAVEHPVLEEALRPYAHRYDAPLGDGAALAKLATDQATRAGL